MLAKTVIPTANNATFAAITNAATKLFTQNIRTMVASPMSRDRSCNGRWMVRVCPFRMAKDAEEQLTKHGARVKFTEYPGGHGWHGNVFGLIRENLDWLQSSR